MSKQATLILRIALFSILGVLLLALVWDRFLAKGGSEAAFETVNGLIDQQHINTEAQGMMNPSDVHAAIGSPSSSVDHDYYLLETFSWRRGNLFSTYYVMVVYTKRQDEWHLHNAFLNQSPPEDRLPQKVGTLPKRSVPTDPNENGDENGDESNDNGEVRD